MKPKMLSGRLAATTLAGGLALAVLLASAGTSAAGDARAIRGVRSRAPSVHHPFSAHRPFVRRHLVSPIVDVSEGFDTVTPVPSIPTVIVQEAPPVFIQQDPPPPPPQPSYYWYYCGPTGKVPSSGEHAPAYCLGGINPSVVVLPGPGKTLEQFQADDAVCLHWASARASTMPGAASPQSAMSNVAGGSVQGQFDIAYQQCMYAKENQIPGLVSTARPGNGTPSPPLPR